MKIPFMSILLPTLSQKDPTKMVVWIFGGQSTVPPLRSSLPELFVPQKTVKPKKESMQYPSQKKDNEEFARF